MAEQSKATVEFENDDAVAEEIRTDINPQDIVQNPSEYAEQMAAQRGCLLYTSPSPRDQA